MSEIFPQSDVPKKNATLLGHQEVILSLQKFLESDDFVAPFTVGLHGSWGSGKTSIMNTLAANLDTTKFHTIFFEAWKFEYSNPSIALVDTIIRSLTDDKEKIKSVMSIALNVLTKKFLDVDAIELWDSFSGISKTTESFSDIIQASISKKLPNQKLLVIIDDLDRCDTKNTLQILSLVKLFLGVDNCICIAAVDFQRLERAWKNVYDISSEDEDGHSYLEKIFQLRMSIPTPNQREITEFISYLLNNDDDPLVEIISTCCPSNPRAIKQMFNLISMRIFQLEGDSYHIKLVPAVFWTLLEEELGRTSTLELYDLLKDSGGFFTTLFKAKKPEALRFLIPSEHQKFFKEGFKERHNLTYSLFEMFKLITDDDLESIEKNFRILYEKNTEIA